MRICLCFLIWLSASLGLAQDMPLAQIIPENQTWKRIEGSFESIGAMRWNQSEKVLELFDLQGNPLNLLDSTAKIIDGKKPIAKSSRHSISHNDKTYAIEKGKLLVDGQEVKIPLKEPTDIAIWNDGGSVVIADAADKYLWAFRLEKDGSLGPGDRYYSLYVPRGQTRSEASDMVFDNVGRLYTGSKEGVQIFDPIGRLCGILAKPGPEPVTAIELGGEKGNLLFVACGKNLFVRPMLSRAKDIPAAVPKKK